MLIPAKELEHDDLIEAGDDTIGQVVGSKQITADEVMLVLVVPADALFELAGKKTGRSK